MQVFESGGALVIRPAAMLWRKFAVVMIATAAGVAVSPAIAVYLLLVN